METKLALTAICFLALAGCASTIKRGHVVMKTSDTEAHVAMGKGEVKLGDHVELYHNRCVPVGGGGKGGGSRDCTKVSGGHGEVTNVINSDYSTVTFPSGTVFAEGDTVEMHVH